MTLKTKNPKRIIVKNESTLINMKNAKIHQSSLNQPILQPLLLLNQLIILPQSLSKLIILLFDKLIIRRLPLNLHLRLQILLILNFDKLIFIFFRRVQAFSQLFGCIWDIVIQAFIYYVLYAISKCFLFHELLGCAGEQLVHHFVEFLVCFLLVSLLDV